MEDFFVGDFVCLKNHPYFENNTFVKIASNASITPPVMVVGETLDKKEYDSLTGKPIEKQLRCYYYSHKDGKFINNWFKKSEIKRLIKKDTYLDIETLESIEKYEIDHLKKTYLYNLVCLKNVDFELNKKKVFFENSDGIKSNKEQNHLDFLSPVMTIIDIVKNKDEKRFSTKDSKFVEKDCSKYMFKCRWYNSQTTAYSEDFLPSNILGLVISNNQALTTIKNLKQDDVFYVYPFDKNLELEDSPVKVKNSLIKVNEIIFNHYYYNFEYFDLLLHKKIAKPIKEINSFIENTNDSKDCLSNEMVFGRSYPSYKRNFVEIDLHIFTENEYFLINYKDKSDNLTKRVIKVIGIYNHTDFEGEEYIFVVANCLLREGNIRHFNIKNILKVTEIKNGITLFE